jgi:16S rRNA (guanine966-N2)-methyltransferase
VRVIAGRFGGRPLATPAGDRTRPTSDRVREAVFSILGPLDGERVLDLFAGTGAFGLEALSRGAGSVVFVERDGRAAQALTRNLKALRVARGEGQLRREEVARALRDASARGETYDLAFLDPPYRLAAGLGAPLTAALRPLLDPGARVVTESDRRAPLDLDLPLSDERRYGDTLIRFHEPA